MAKIPVAVQMWSVRKEAKADLAGTLKALAEMGYEGVEFAGFYERSAEELKALLAEVGLKAVGSHVGEDVLQPENLEETIAFHKTLGDKFLTVAWHDPSDDPEEWKAFARRLTEAAAALAPHGLYTGYHTHGHDAHPLAGSTVWDLVAQNSSDAVVMQLDLGNAAAGGGDAMAMLKKYLSRARTVHLKDYSAANKNQPLLGDGDLPWAEVLGVVRGKRRDGMVHRGAGTGVGGRDGGGEEGAGVFEVVGEVGGAFLNTKARRDTENTKRLSVFVLLRVLCAEGRRAWKGLGLQARVTREDIVSGLRNLGVQTGEVILVHSSLRHFGYLEGGPEMVIEALLEVVGAEGTLALPGFSFQLKDLPSPVFDVRNTPVWASKLYEAFRTRPGVLRSHHVTHSVCALGARERELTGEHSQGPCGPESPFRKIVEWGGKIVLMGVSHNANTTFHAVEEQEGAVLRWLSPVGGGDDRG